MREKLQAYYEVGRPMNTIAGALTVLVGGYVADNGHWWDILLAALVTLLVTASSNASNDYVDVEIDKINQPQRVIPSGRLSRREVLSFSLILALLSLIIAYFINWPAFGIVLFCNFLLYAYSWKLKSTVLLGNITVAIMAATGAILGGVAAGNPAPSFWLAFVIAIVMLAREILKTMVDYEGDLAQECHTISTVWGQKVAQYFFYVIFTLAFGSLILPYLQLEFNILYLIIIVVGIYPVMVYVITQVRHNASSEKLERMSTLLKYDFFIWFIAIFISAKV